MARSVLLGTGETAAPADPEELRLALQAAGVGAWSLDLRTGQMRTAVTYGRLLCGPTAPVDFGATSRTVSHDASVPDFGYWSTTMPTRSPSLAGSAPNLPAVPGTGDGDGSGSPELKLETSVPELPPVEIQAPTQSLPQVDVPTLELPSTDDVTDALPKLP